MQTALEHCQVVGAIYVVAPEITPDAVEFRNRDAKSARLGCQHDRIDRAGGGPADNAERINRSARHEFGDRLHHAYLKRTSRSAPGEHQCSLLAVRR